MGLPPLAPEASGSTNFATSARGIYYINQTAVSLSDGGAFYGEVG